MSRKSCLEIIRKMPKVTLDNVQLLPKPTKIKDIRSMRQSKDEYSKAQSIHPIGIIGMKLPWYMRIPISEMYDKKYFERPMVTFSLQDLQRAIDLNRLDPSEPIDITSLCNSRLINLDTRWIKHYGVSLLEDGEHNFVAKVNVEVQYASESAIAAIERAGGSIITRYYDLYSVDIKRDPEKFFLSGLPLPKCKIPPQNAISYYSEASNRGYLSDPDMILKERYKLSQKYGYKLISEEEYLNNSLLQIRKDPRQLFYDLEPGWVVNLTDKEVLIPTDPELKHFYSQ